MSEEPAAETEKEVTEEPAAEIEEEATEEPAAETEEEATEEPAAETEEEATEEQGPADGIEIVITKALKIGESWSGILRPGATAILKLDLEDATDVLMLCEGTGIQAAIQKADRQNEAPLTGTAEADSMSVNWEAEKGSYLITLQSAAEAQYTKVSVSFADRGAAAVTEDEEAPADETEEIPGEADPETEPEAEPETEAEAETEAETEPETEAEPEAEVEKSITVSVSFDSPNPVIGDTAHFKAELEGYEKLNYTVQWQYSPDREIWTDLTGETEETMDIVVTNENNLVFWRIVVYVEEDEEA